MYIVYSCVFNQRSFKNVFVKNKKMSNKEEVKLETRCCRMMSMTVQPSESYQILVLPRWGRRRDDTYHDEVKGTRYFGVDWLENKLASHC